MYLALCSFTQKRLLVRLKFQQSNEIFISLDCAIFKGRFTKTQRLEVKPLTRVTASSQRNAEQNNRLIQIHHHIHKMYR